VNGYKRQPFTAYRAVDPPRSCVSRLPRRHRGLEIVAALHNRERSNNEAAGIAHNPPVTMVATPTIRDRVSRLLYLVYSETRASLFGPTAVTASPRPSSYAPRFALGIQIVAKMRPHSRPVGAHDQGGRSRCRGAPVTGRCRLLVNCAVSRDAGWPGSAHQPHTAGCLQLRLPDHEE
jgi:hypothetical protein